MSSWPALKRQRLLSLYCARQQLCPPPPLVNFSIRSAWIILSGQTCYIHLSAAMFDRPPQRDDSLLGYGSVVFFGVEWFNPFDWHELESALGECLKTVQPQ